MGQPWEGREKCLHWACKNGKSKTFACSFLLARIRRSIILISILNLIFQYKDAFFTANPNFKWYKLPAPPLRTLSTRPSNLSPSQDYVFDFPSTASHYVDSEPPTRERLERQKSSDMSLINGTVTKGPKGRKNSGVGVFKLADETQMGGLSSLLLNNCDSVVQSEEGE